MKNILNIFSFIYIYPDLRALSISSFSLPLVRMYQQLIG